MNPKLQKVIRDIERTKAKVTELQALLPELERQKTELENSEFIKALRSADVAPEDLTAFIEAYKKNRDSGSVQHTVQPTPTQNILEDGVHEEKI